MKASIITAYLSVYGFTHALVDASCVMLLLGGIDVKAELPSYILLYNVLAFGLQLPFGWVLDRIQKPVLSAVAGCIMLSLALMLFLHPLAAILLAGTGNALFHVGGGTISLNLRPGKASIPGLFVAPGGIGLFAGGVILKSSGFHPEYFVVLLLCMGVVMFLLKSPPVFYGIKREKQVNFLILAILLLLITICIRSAVGLSAEFPWKSNITLLIMLTLSIALGKGLGGFLADYFGWIKISVGGLALSALLLFFGAQFPASGIAGMFLFNLTMPVTLVAISNLLPGKPGFSFGLTTFALVAGALPAFLGYKSFLSGGPVILILILLSAVILFIGLRLYEQNKP